MDDAVRLRSTVCLLGRFPALAGVDLTVTRGETLLVRGANGAGKTTLFRALAGLVPVVEGHAEVLGCDLRRDRRAVRRRVGLLGHGAALYDDLTVADNLRFWARAGRARGADLPGAMARFGLDGRLADVLAARLSAGQRRRAALAVLVARAPELWLLDEPHAGLDAAGRDVLDDLVREVAAAGSTVVLASHELDRAATLATRSVTLAGGRFTGDVPPWPDAVQGPAPQEPVHVV
jgi:heme ABC exporter ATP-binding subunit CcmA